MKQYEFLVIDTETTGLTEQDEVIEFSAVGPDGSTVYSTRIKPSRICEWPDAEKVNHIAPADLASERTAAELKDEIESLLASARTIVGYNLPFDLRLLSQSGIRIPSSVKTLDVMPLATSYFGRRTSLGNVTARFGYSFGEGERHSSAGDAKATLAALQFLSGEA